MSCEIAAIRRCPYCGRPPEHQNQHLADDGQHVRFVEYHCPIGHVWAIPVGEPVYAPTYPTREMRPLR